MHQNLPKNHRQKSFEHGIQLRSLEIFEVYNPQYVGGKLNSLPSAKFLWMFCITLYQRTIVSMKLLPAKVEHDCT